MTQNVLLAALPAAAVQHAQPAMAAMPKNPTALHVTVSFLTLVNVS